MSLLHAPALPGLRSIAPVAVAVLAAACSEPTAAPVAQPQAAAAVTASESLTPTANANSTLYVIRRLRYTQSCSGMTCTFDASTSSGFTSYVWSFGDGTMATGAKVTHTFPSPKGAYMLALMSGGASVRKLVTCTAGSCF